MTKRELIDEVMKLYPRFSRRDAEIMVNAVFDSMTEALSRDERIEVRGFGSFVVKHRQARREDVGRLPGGRGAVGGDRQPRAALSLRISPQPLSPVGLAEIEPERPAKPVFVTDGKDPSCVLGMECESAIDRNREALA